MTVREKLLEMGLDGPSQVDPLLDEYAHELAEKIRERAALWDAPPGAVRSMNMIALHGGILYAAMAIDPQKTIRPQDEYKTIPDELIHDMVRQWDRYLRGLDGP